MSTRVDALLPISPSSVTARGLLRGAEERWALHRHGRDIAHLVLAEPEGVRRRRGFLRYADRRAEIAGHRHLRDRNQQAAVGAIVQQAVTTTRQNFRERDVVAVAFFCGKVNRRRRALFAAVQLAQEDRLAQMTLCLADQQNSFTRVDEKAMGADFEASAITPTPPITGVGRMPLPLVSL